MRGPIPKTYRQNNEKLFKVIRQLRFYNTKILNINITNELNEG